MNAKAIRVSMEELAMMTSTCTPAPVHLATQELTVKV